MITCLRTGHLCRIQSLTAGLSACLSGSIILRSVLNRNYQNTEQLWQNPSALPRLLLVLQTTILTVSVKNTYNVWRENEDVRHCRLQYTLKSYVYLSTPMGQFKINHMCVI